MNSESFQINFEFFFNSNKLNFNEPNSIMNLWCVFEKIKNVKIIYFFMKNIFFHFHTLIIMKYIL